MRFNMRLFILLALAAIPSIQASDIRIEDSQSTNWTAGQTVQTSSGPVEGHPGANNLQVSEYLGIPYAQAPIGSLRFAAPVAFTGSTTINGSAFGFSCPVKQTSSALPTPQESAAANLTSVGVEVLFGTLSNNNGLYGENCLNLNVWTKPQTGDAKKAVLVWIYGGGFHKGSSAIPAYNGTSLAEMEDVVVVSLNYRLSILGFPGNPSSANNLALLDQRLAVEWVRDNIANFGGDPTRITLFGQSAGAASVDLYSYAWNSDPIAAGFIAESGNVFSWGLPYSQDDSSTAWYTVTSTLGCGNAASNPATVLSCMRKQNYNAILQAVPDAAGSSLSIFGPTVDNTVVFSNYSQIIPANLPMLIGSNDYEAGLFRTYLAFSDYYRSDVFWDDFTLVDFTCTSGIRANASVAARNPTWRYRYFGVFPNMAISPEAGTFHEAEIPMIFNTFPTTPASTPAQSDIGNYMRGAWAAFAKDPSNGLTNYGWPTYDTIEDTLIRLAYNNLTGTNVINPYRYDADCVFVNVSDTNSSDWGTYPDLGASVTPTGTSAPSNTAGGSSTSTATGPSATKTKNAAAKADAAVWVRIGAGVLAAAYLI